MLLTSGNCCALLNAVNTATRSTEMSTVELASAVHNDLSLLAQAWKLDASGAVQRLIAEFRNGGDRAATQPAAVDRGDPTWVEVYADYHGTRVSGQFHTKTKALEITSGVKNPKIHKTVSGAAAAVVAELNPSVDPNRNGWTFWNIAETGETLQQIRHR